MYSISEAMFQIALFLLFTISFRGAFQAQPTPPPATPLSPQTSFVHDKKK
jgi:hypothetical protein